MKFSTKAIHVGQTPDKETGAMVPPIYMTSTYIQEEPGVTKGYDYTRAGNPNYTNLEATLAALEQGTYATVFSSGLAAMHGAISMLTAGDDVLAVDDLYGGTYRLFKQVFEKFGISFRQISFKDTEEIEREIRPNTKLLMLETPSNPLLKIVDIAQVTQIAKRRGVLTMVDNTFASPYFQQPLTLGADMVLHSGTKYLGGHSDLISGAVITNDEVLGQKLQFARKAIGGNPSPFDVWLISRSLKTLEVRMEAHQKNAFAVARFLSDHPKVKTVFYPGLPSHPDHEIARKQMKGFSGIVSVSFNLSLDDTKKLISSFKLFSLAESLGGVESLVDHPASMTHASIPREEREKAGLTDGLVRFSVGLEDKDDLINDIQTALGKI